jgi:hypothetical protein
MIDAAHALTADNSRQSDCRTGYAIWAQRPRRRGLGLAAIYSGAIIRMRPVMMLNLAVALCVVSGLGMFALATYALAAEG